MRAHPSGLEAEQREAAARLLLELPHQRGARLRARGPVDAHMVQGDCCSAAALGVRHPHLPGRLLQRIQHTGVVREYQQLAACACMHACSVMTNAWQRRYETIVA